MKIQTKFAIGFALVAVGVSVLLSLSHGLWMRERLRQSIRDRLRDTVALAALQIDAGQHEQLRSAADEGGAAYLRVRRSLQRIRDAARDIRYVYTMRPDMNGRLVFVVDAETNPPEISHLDEPYIEPGPVLKSEFLTLDRPAVEEEFYTDRWGTWRSGYAAFFTPDGRRAGILGMDIAATTVLRAEQELYRKALLFFTLSLPLCLILGLFLGRRLAAPIRSLLAGAERVRLGTLDQPVEVVSRDEIGTLARSFNAMTAQLQLPMEQLRAEVAERQRTAEKLKSECLFNNKLIQHSPAYFVAFSGTGRTLMMNETMLRALGYSPSEVAGADYLTTFVPEEERPLLSGVFSRNVDFKEKTVNENHIVTKDGRKLLVEWHSGVVLNEQGELDFFFGLGIDITRRRQAEAAIRDRELQYRTLFESANDAIFIMREDLFADCNRKTLEMFGCSQEEILNQPPYRFSPPFQPDGRDSREKALEKIQAALAGEPQFFEWVHSRLDGTPFYAEVSLNGLDVAGRRMIQAIVRDIDQRKKAETALRQAHDQLEARVRERPRELHEANEELKKFAYIVSHDLRAPLVNLQGFSRELRTSLETIGGEQAALLSGLPEERRAALRAVLNEDLPESLGFIESAAGRMDGLINAILKLSRLGHRELDFQPIDLNALLKNLLPTFNHQVEQRRTRIEIDPLPELRADRLAMEQIFGNLLDNALKFMPPGRTGWVRIWGEKDGDQTVFHVQDNGRGIPPEDLTRIFEIFRRAGPQDVPGEGMGLSYVQTMGRRHGGRIWADSQLDRGTTVSFTISNLL